MTVNINNVYNRHTNKNVFIWCNTDMMITCQHKQNLHIMYYWNDYYWNDYMYYWKYTKTCYNNIHDTRIMLMKLLAVDTDMAVTLMNRIRILNINDKGKTEYRLGEIKSLHAY